MKTEMEIRKDALIMSLLYSVFGFMGIGIFCMFEIVIPSQTPEITFPMIYHIMFYIPLIIGLGMFWFSYKVYCWEVESDRKWNLIFSNNKQKVGSVE